MSISRTWRDLILLKVSGYHPNAVAMYLVTLVRNFFSDLLPARIGSLIYIYLITNKLGISFGAATSSFAFSFLFDMISLSILVIFAVGLIASNLFSPLIIGVASFVLLVVCIAILLFLPKLFQSIANMIIWFPFKTKRLLNRWAEAIAAVGQEVSKSIQSGIYLRVLMLSFFVRAGKYLSLYALLIAIVVPIGYNIEKFPLPKVFLGLCGAEMSASLPISGIAGFGVYEGAWSVVFQILGYSKEVSALTSIAHHLISQVYGYTLGALALIFLLLPMFNSNYQNVVLNIKPETSRFWYWFAGLLLITVGLTWLLFTPFVFHQNAIAANKNLSKEGMEKKYFSCTDWQREFPQLTGKVVYELPDGIYAKQFVDVNSKRLVSGGTYPRWSPDGKLVAYLKDKSLCLISIENLQNNIMISIDSPKAIAFHPDGNLILFTDGNAVRSFDTRSLKVETITSGKRYLEIDISKDNSYLAYTTKKMLGGYQVEVMKVKDNEINKISMGCSASLSPLGDFVTVNSEGHQILSIFDVKSKMPLKEIKGPLENLFDNHSWSNLNEWIACINETDNKNIYIIEVSSSRFWKMTDFGDCDRPDIFIQENKLK